MTTRDVQVATLAERDAVNAVLTLAFSGDPASRWTWPDPKAYLEAFPHFATAFGGAAFAKGSALRVGSAGAALWLPPGTDSDEAAMNDLMMRTADAATAIDGPQLMQQMATYHPREPHWYLPLLGVDPAHQNKGVGRRAAAPRHRPLRSRRRARLSRIVQPAEHPVVRAAWLRDPGPRPVRRLARDHAHAAQAPREDKEAMRRR